jgi:hypothetical protein
MRCRWAATIVGLGLLCHSGFSCVFAQALELGTQDGLVLELSRRGQVTGLVVAGRPIPLHQSGGFFVIDYQNQPQAKNLVPNPGFEEGAQGWSLSAGQAIDEEIAHGGRRSVRLEVPGPEPGTCNLGVQVPVKRGRRYRVGLWMRRHRCGVCGAYVSELDAQGKPCGGVGQLGLPVPQEDDVWSFASRELQVGPNTAQLLLRADIYRSTGTLWLDDFYVAEVPDPVAQPVVGEATRQQKAVRLVGQAAGCELQVTWTAEKSCLRAEGVLRDRLGQDRAVGLSFRLPFAAQGWTWYDDFEERRTVGAAEVYEFTYDCVSGEGRCSVYPWSALSGPDVGLSLAVPLAQGPRVFILDYHGQRQAYEVTFFFGLTRDTWRAPSSARFCFVLYQHDPAWGMRAAAQRYYELFPDSFLKRPLFEGYLNYANLERYDPERHSLVVEAKNIEDASDFGEGYAFIWHLHGCYWFTMFHTEDTSFPSDEAVRAFLQAEAAHESEKPPGSYYTPPSEVLKKLVYGPEGRIAYIGDTRYWNAHEGYNHTDKPGWGLNFRVNEDPGVSDYLARVSRERVKQYVAEKHPAAFSAALTADAIEGYFSNSTCLDYRREHFHSTTLPLTFGKGNLQPALPNTIWDFLDQVWRPLTQEYRVVTYGNANGYEQAFTLPYCDVPMIEWDWDVQHPGRLERYCRALAYHKIWRFWRVCGRGEQDRDSVLQHFHRCLAYAIFPAVYPLVTVSGNLDDYRALFRQYVPAIEALSRAGWEPIPYANCEPPEVVVERFGSFARHNLHFTLRNYASQPVKAKVRLQLNALGIPASAARELWAYDLLAGAHQARPIEPEDWEVEVPARGARAFWVGTRAGLARNALAAAGYDLGRIERLCAADLTAPLRAAIGRCRQQLTEALQSPAASLRAAAQAVDALAEQLLALETKAPVDLGKLAYRLKTDLAGAGVARAGVCCAGPRAVECVGGQSVAVPFELTNASSVPVQGLRARLLSLWPQAQQMSKVECEQTKLGPGSATVLQAQLLGFPAAQRNLLPYLIELAGTSAGEEFRIFIPVDVVLRPVVSLRGGPWRVSRGGETTVRLLLTNAADRPVRGRLQLGPLRGVTFSPPAQDFTIPPADHVELPVAVRVEESVHLGGLLVPFAVASDDPALATAGTLELRVVTAFPRAVVRRLWGPVTVDGRLTEAAWQEAPTIPELRLMESGRPAGEKTCVWLAYDDQGLYAAFRCSESNMPAIKAQLTERGAPLYRDDDVELFFLPPAAPTPLQFAINPLGTRSDNFGNQAPWQAAAARLPTEWTVEVFIPYRVLGLPGPPSKGFVLPAQFGRQQKPKSEVTSWSPTTAFINADRFGELVFE